MRSGGVSSDRRRGPQGPTTATIAVLVCLLLMPLPSAAQGTPAPTGTVTSSETIKGQVEALQKREVLRRLRGLPAGPVTTAISPRELQNLVDRNMLDNSANAGYRTDEIVVRAPPAVSERPLQSQIPVGLAGIGWGIRHPSQAWRLFLPVLS